MKKIWTRELIEKAYCIFKRMKLVERTGYYLYGGMTIKGGRKLFGNVSLATERFNDETISNDNIYYVHMSIYSFAGMLMANHVFNEFFYKKSMKRHSN